MVRTFRFGVVSDPHITLPHTFYDTPNRFHIVEVSIPALEQILAELEHQNLDFLLLPGDLTQHGERENHEWLADRLAQLPFPAFTVPGNHDIIQPQASDCVIGLQEFPQIYRRFGYDSDRPYYCREVLPGIHLLGLNSIAFDDEGRQLPVGHLDAAQLDWLSATLANLKTNWVMVMVHHNVLEHLPGQARHPLGQRYILQNRWALLDRLRPYPVKLLFTGHLHVQDVTQWESIWEITTGSLVSYPHPYRIVEVALHPGGQAEVKVQSQRIAAVPNLPDLQGFSQQWMRDRSIPFIVKLLTCPPLGLSVAEAERFAPILQDFWASISAGDHDLDYPQLPAKVRQHLRQFGAIDRDGTLRAIDNTATLSLAW